MIDLKINHGMASIQVLGSTSDITTETLLGIKGIYEGLKERDSECAEMYKEMILKTINTAFLTTEEVHDLAKEKMNSLFDGLLKSVKGNESLEDVLMELKEAKLRENE